MMVRSWVEACEKEWCRGEVQVPAHLHGAPPWPTWEVLYRDLSAVMVIGVQNVEGTSIHFSVRSVWGHHFPGLAIRTSRPLGAGAGATSPRLLGKTVLW